MYEVREVLRLWLDGEGLRSIERLSAVARKTVRRYVTAAEGLGLDRDEQLGYDASRWGGQLDAIAIGDEIYVTSTIGEQRTVLIGTVDTAAASS